MKKIELCIKLEKISLCTEFITQFFYKLNNVDLLNRFLLIAAKKLCDDILDFICSVML
jgi:hypothetical protein